MTAISKLGKRLTITIAKKKEPDKTYLFSALNMLFSYYRHWFFNKPLMTAFVISTHVSMLDKHCKSRISLVLRRGVSLHWPEHPCKVLGFSMKHHQRKNWGLYAARIALKKEQLPHLSDSDNGEWTPARYISCGTQYFSFRLGGSDCRSAGFPCLPAKFVVLKGTKEILWGETCNRSAIETRLVKRRLHPISSSWKIS